MVEVIEDKRGIVMPQILNTTQVQTPDGSSTSETDSSIDDNGSIRMRSPSTGVNMRGRVQSLLGPQSVQQQPETLLITGSDPSVLDDTVIIGNHRYPIGSQQVLLMRGDHGFGISLINRKVLTL